MMARSHADDASVEYGDRRLGKLMLQVVSPPPKT